MNYVLFTFSILLGYLFNRSISKSGGTINRKLPYIKIRFLQIGPNIKIHLGKRSFHIHHWITYSVVLIITLTSNAGILDTLFSKGLLVGGIIQGLTFSDWKKIVINKGDK